MIGWGAHVGVSISLFTLLLHIHVEKLSVLDLLGSGRVGYHHIWFVIIRDELIH